MALDKKTWFCIITNEQAKSQFLSMVYLLWQLVLVTLLLLKNFDPMVVKYSGMMKLGVTSMKKNRTFGLMAQQAQAVFGKVMEKVNSALRLI